MPDYQVPRTVTAVKTLRRMRGGSQARLLLGDDGRYYVTKFGENPQGRRTLVNELLSWFLLHHLGFAVPEAAFVNVTEGFLDANPDVAIETGRHRRKVRAGRHFGSALLADPACQPVYDFLPDALLGRVLNVCELVGVLVFDKWVANSDWRQAVFYRRLIPDIDPRYAYRCCLIDNGLTFNGPEWNYRQGPLSGLYVRRTVYRSVRSIEDFEPWLDLSMRFPEELLRHALSSVPAGWLIEGDFERLERLLARLLERRKIIPDLVRGTCESQPEIFPRWSRKRRAPAECFRPGLRRSDPGARPCGAGPPLWQ